MIAGGRWWSPGGLDCCRGCRWSPSGGWISCRASWAAAPMGPRSLVPVPGFPGSLGPVPPTFDGCRASLGQFRRLSAGSGLPGCRWLCSWAVFGLLALVFCMVGRGCLPAAAFVAVGGLDPAAIYTYTRARRGSCRVVSRSDGEKPVQRYTRARCCCRWCAISNGAGRFGRRAISNGSRKIMKAACNP